MVQIITLSACVDNQVTICKTEFSKEELLSDYDQLWKDLYENYPFFSILERKGVDTEALYNEGRETIKQRVTNLEGFVAAVNDIFYRMNYNFAHLSVCDVNTYEVLVNAYCGDEISAEEYAIWKEILLDKQTQVTYDLLKGDEIMEGIEKTEDIAKKGGNIVARYYPEIKTAYFGFQSFHMNLIEADEGVVENYLKEFEEVENIIIDVTGNSGGATSYWMMNIVEPIGGEYLSDRYVFFADSPVNRKFYEGLNLQPIAEIPTEYTLPGFVEELNMTYYCLNQRNVSNPETEWSDVKRWVLIDGRVYSAADDFAMFCKDTGWATLIGQRSRGDGASGITPVMIRLENTGLLVRFSTGCVANSEGLLNTEYGTIPDIICPTKQSILQKCKDLIEESYLK